CRLDGTPGAVQMRNPEDNTVEDLPSKFPCRKTKVGDTLRTVSPCGGGYGDPLERDPALVLEDVLDGFVSIASARRDYGVVIDPASLTLDEPATAALRQSMG
ncbi:MAG: hydantoinase B/oxoprolinase family protein, partial [Cyanobacteria bacterium J06626_26]